MLRARLFRSFFLFCSFFSLLSLFLSLSFYLSPFLSLPLSLSLLLQRSRESPMWGECSCAVMAPVLPVTTVTTRNETKQLPVGCPSTHRLRVCCRKNEPLMLLTLQTLPEAFFPSSFLKSLSPLIWLYWRYLSRANTRHVHPCCRLY